MQYNYLGKYKKFRIQLKQNSYLADRKLALTLIQTAKEKYDKEEKIAVIALVKDNIIIFYNNLVYENLEEFLKQIKEFKKEKFEVISTETSDSYIKYELHRNRLMK